MRQGRLTRFAPGVAALGDYQRSWFRPDLLAGVTVWAMLVPQAHGYGDSRPTPLTSSARCVEQPRWLHG